MWWMAAIEGAKSIGRIYSGMQESERQEDEVREQKRRMRLQHEQTLEAGRAAAGASGLVTGASSLDQHLAAMAKEFAREERWAYEAGMDQATATANAAWWGGTSDFAGAMFRWGQSSNWGKQPQQQGGEP